MLIKENNWLIWTILLQNGNKPVWRPKGKQKPKRVLSKVKSTAAALILG